jgi:predicted TPR repeat methyltransferase
MDYGVTTFGERNADTYDSGPERADTPHTVDRLVELADRGPALELAIGTGRVGLKLAQRGVRVDGIEASQAMVDKLRAKPGGDQLEVRIGNYADVDADGRYRLIFVVYNTLSNLQTQDEQVRCFANVAAHLEDGAVFVVEAGVPDLDELRARQYVHAEYVELDEVGFDVARIDPISQRVDENHVELGPNGIRNYPVVTRYTWPSEMDLMARLAGLRLRERWGGWLREPFTAASTSQISIYER